MKRAILVGIDSKRDLYDINYSLNELKALASECDILSCQTMIQKGEVNKVSYIGSGKLEELKVEIKMYNADIVIFNDELSPLMLKTLNDELDIEVIDRSLLILDIFLKNARTNEAKMEIKLAHLKYLYPRLSSLRDGFDRQGGIGSKGSGETQLELDRRHVSNEIIHLERELEESHKMKENQIKRRQKDGIKTVALVGYTNAGKSTTMNSIIDYTENLTSKKVLAQNRLFATLTTSVRRIEYNNTTFLLSDTVGFVSKIPNHLIHSFNETLLEASNADLIIVVLDASSKYAYLELQTTINTLYSLGLSDKKMLILLNKIDLCETMPKISGVDYLPFSNVNLEYMDKLLSYITNTLNKGMLEMTVLIPFADGKALNFIRENTKVISQIYLDSGIQITLKCDARYYKKLSMYEPNDSSLES